LLLISDDYKTILTNPYILGFRYVGKTLTETLSGLGGSNQAEVDAIETSIGLNTNGTFPAFTTTSYLNSATNVKEALLALDTAVSGKVSAISLAQVATTGSYADLSDKPLLFSGSYTDLTNKPPVFSGSYNDLTDKPLIPAAQVQADWAAVNGLSSILNKPILFSGNYADLIGSPTVVSAFTNDAGYLVAADIAGKANTSYVDTQVIALQTQIDALVTHDLGDVTQSNITTAVAAEALIRQEADAAILAQIASTTALEGIFVIGVTPTSTGLIGGQVYAPNTTPANKVVLECVSDTPNVKITVGVDGSAKSYSPIVTIGGVTATIAETSTLRWFTATADLVIGEGTETITVVSNTGATTSVDITLAGAGPNILSAVIGTYPNSQTALKVGDVVSVTLTTELSATHVTIVSGGATSTNTTHAVTNGSVTIPVTINSSSGQQALSFKAKNSFGTFGVTYVTALLSLDQTPPTFGVLSVSYPANQGALITGDSATVSCVVNNASSVSYSATGLTVSAPTTYAASKTVSLATTGYVDSGTNYLITASKASNGTTATKTGLVLIATTAPTGAITTSPSGRMVGSPTGVNYTITITSTQSLKAAPSLSASAGAWSGNWSGSGKVWSRILVISDTTPKGAAFFSTLELVNQTNIIGSTISAGTTYVVGGFTSRILTIPSFSRVVAIGADVLDATKSTCQITGGNVLTYYADNTVRANGYYIANSDGTFNPLGAYIGLSDSAFAGSNTTGTLQITVSETAS
jgi:hypothetical protein